VAYLSSLLRIVSEENRLKLLCFLLQKKHCVCELIKHGDMSQSLISHYLKDLKNAGLVANKKQGIRVYYSLTNKGRYIANLLFKISQKEEKL